MIDELPEAWFLSQWLFSTEGPTDLPFPLPSVPGGFISHSSQSLTYECDWKMSQIFISLLKKQEKSSICFYRFIYLLNNTNLFSYCNKLTSSYSMCVYIGKFFKTSIKKTFSPFLSCWSTDITSELTVKFPEEKRKFFWLKQQIWWSLAEE